VSSPAIRRSVVVLPAPLGPSRTKNSPAATSRSRLFTARTAPKRLPRPRNVRLAMAQRLAMLTGGFAAEQPRGRLVEQHGAFGARTQPDGCARLGTRVFRRDHF